MQKSQGANLGLPGSKASAGVPGSSAICSLVLERQVCVLEKGSQGGPEMQGRKGSRWLHSQQRQVSHAWGQAGPAPAQRLSVLRLQPQDVPGVPEPPTAPRPVPRLQTDLSSRMQKARSRRSPNRCQVQKGIAGKQ